MKSIKKKIGISLIAVLLTCGIIAALVSHNDVKTQAAYKDDNGETPITIENKSPILDRIMEKGEKLVILEIVPYERASVFNMLAGSDKVRAKLEERKEELFKAYDWGAVADNGTVKTVYVGKNGSAVFNDHNFTISYNRINKEYVVNYPNYFLEEFLDGYHNPQALSYFSKNLEIRTVPAGLLTEEDLKDVSFIYISSFVETEQIAGFNAYIDGLVTEEQTKNSVTVGAGVYDKNGNEYTVSQSKNVWYDAFVKNDKGELVPNDMSWDMVVKLVNYIYEGNAYTKGSPIPCLINYGNPRSKTANIHKLTNLITKTSNEEGTVYTTNSQSVSTYYLDVLKNIITYEGELDGGNTDEPVIEKNISIYVSNTPNWKDISIRFRDNAGVEKSIQKLTTNEKNTDWYEIVVPYTEKINFTFTNGDSSKQTVEIKDVKDGEYWYVLEEESGDADVEIIKADKPEGWIEKEVEKPVEPERNYYLNAYGIKTGAYVSNGNAYVDWSSGNNSLIFDMKCTEAGEYTFNHVYKTMNNYLDSVYTIGKANVPDLTDNGTAGIRGIGKNGKYTVTDILKYLLGVEDNNNDPIKVLEIEPCQDYKYTYSSSDSANKKQQVVNNIMELAKALRIREYTKTDGSVAAYEAMNKCIEFKSMTVLQFNGMNEDLMSTYDIIYIGDNSGMFNYSTNDFYDNTGSKVINSVYKDSSIPFVNNIPIYNDKKLDGYVYTAFGDLIKGEQLFLGYLPSDYVDVTSYKGNNTSWEFSSKPKTTGVVASTKRMFSIDPSVTKNSDLWTPLIYGTLKSDSAKYYIVKNLRTDIGGPISSCTDYSNTLGNMRYSATDLSKRKKQEIMEYVKYGNPVILADNVYNCTNTSIYNKNGGIVYPTSQVYDFVKTYTGEGTSLKPSRTVLESGIVSSANIYSDLLISLNEYQLTVKNVTCDYLIGASWNRCPAIEYNADNAIKQTSIVTNPEKMRYSIDFNAVVGKDYMVTLVYDKNTDGKYNEEATTDDKNEVFYRTRIKADSKNETFAFEIPIPNGYNGMFSWRIIVSELNGSTEVDRGIYDGFVIIKGDKKVVKVLQLLPAGKVELNLATNETYNQLLAAAAGVINYEIIVDTMVAGDFEKLYEGDWAYTRGVDYNTEKNFIKYGRTETVTRDITNKYEVKQEVKSTETVTKYYYKKNNGINGKEYVDVDDTYTRGDNRYYWSGKKEYIVSTETTTNTTYQYYYIKDGNRVNINNVSDIKVENGKNYIYITTQEIVEAKSFGGDYSMIVIGFSDCYGEDDISDDNGALSNIIDFIGAGGSILFTHDTIAFTNNVNYGFYRKTGQDSFTTGSSSGKTKYGDKMSLDFTRRMRDLVGMDRYSVTSITDFSATSLEEAHVPKDIDGNYITEIQGFTNFWLLFRSMSSNDKTYAAAYKNGDNVYFTRDNKTTTGHESRETSGYTLGPTKNFLNYSIYNFPLTTQKADEINVGQVTCYPYKTTDSSGQISVASTHGQYNQLDLEDPDIVVWYTLSGNNNTYYGDNKGDASNNYYIYSKDNITYSGAGHSTLNSKQELKLFVNTIIKAADAGNYVPKVEILNGSKMRDADSYVIYASTLDKDVKVEFVARDDDLASRDTVSNMYSNEEDILSHIGRFNQGYVYWIDASGDKHVLIEYEPSTNRLLNGEKNSFYICDPYVNDKNTGVAYQSKEVMKACYDEYTKAGTVKLYFEAIDSKGAPGSSTATIVNHDLFDLD